MKKFHYVHIEVLQDNNPQKIVRTSVLIFIQTTLHFNNRLSFEEVRVFKEIILYVNTGTIGTYLCSKHIHQQVKNWMEINYFYSLICLCIRLI